VILVALIQSSAFYQFSDESDKENENAHIPSKQRPESTKKTIADIK